MLRIEKFGGKKVIFYKFLCRERKKCTWQRNSLPRARQLALGKEIFGECFFLCRELSVWLSAKEPVCQVFFLCRVPNKKLLAKPSWPRVFYLALGTEPDSRQRLKFR
jgi:hypothetical protein